MLSYELHQRQTNCSLCKSVHLSLGAAVHSASVYGYRPGVDFILEVPSGPDYPEPYDFARKIELEPCQCGECVAWRVRAAAGFPNKGE